MQNRLNDYATALYQAENFEDAFSAFEDTVLDLGIDGVLYTYIPRILMNSNFYMQPVFQSSKGFCPKYLNHYSEARFEKHDPLIRAVSSGEKGPIDWWGETCEQYKSNNESSREVIDVTRSYGIRNGLTIPLMSGEKGIAGASFISHDRTTYSLLMAEKLDELTIRTKMFHNLVVSNACFLREFTKPLVASFSQTQLRYLAGLASGKKTSEIAAELGTTPGYLDQSIIRLRRKLSGTDETETPSINRNQLLYYAGLLNILESSPE